MILNLSISIFLLFGVTYFDAVQASAWCNKIYDDALTSCQLANSGSPYITVERCEMQSALGGVSGRLQCSSNQYTREDFCRTLADSMVEKSLRTNSCIFLSDGGGGTADPLSEGEDFDVPENRKPAGSDRSNGGSANNNNEDLKPTDGTTMADLQKDLSTCRDNGTNAVKCCTRPQECGARSNSSSVSAPSSNDSEGIKRYCEQMKYASLQGQRENSSAAGVCSSNHNACSLQCSRAKQKWEQALSNCRSPNCDQAQVQQAISIFSRNESDCKKLVDNEKLLAQQSAENLSAAQQSQLCAQQASMDPSSLANQNKADTASAGIDCSGENATKPECVDCSKYPNSPTCMGNGYQNESYGSAALREAAGSGLSMNDFNVQNSDGLSQFPNFNSTEAKAVQGTAIPNGGGGGMMGGAGGGQMGDSASTGANGQGGGYDTDILNGVSGGGGFSGDAGAPTGGGGGFSGYGQRGGDSKNPYTGLDLKQYLPGGKKDPAKRNVASMQPGSGHPEILDMGKSMFKTISDRYSNMCKLKQFIGCE